MKQEPPLAGIRIVDCVAGPLAAITRILAELGARVDRLAPLETAGSTDEFDDFAANIGKQNHDFGPQSPSAEAVFAAADVIVGNAGLDFAALRANRPALVTMAVSDFGTNNSFSAWQATDAVIHALSGELCRSGIRGRAPLLPPAGLAYQCAATQGAYAIVASLYRALRDGAGMHLDFSALEGAVQGLDPGYGIGGSATLGKPAKLLSRDRPVAGIQYPILPCADGHVRICLLAARQWQGMFKWMGEPPAFADPSFNKTVVRYKSPELLPAITDFFQDKTRAELEHQGQRYGVPIAALATLGEAIETEHFRERGTFKSFTLAPDRSIRMPTGALVVDGARAAGDADVQAVPSWPSKTTGQAKPIFDGVKVLDLGVIVVGAETSRLLADQGADVVKLESRAFPDGNRQSYLAYDLSVSFAAGHRNKRSLGLDLRNPVGKQIFLDLVAQADVVLSNFKPGTMTSLGLDFATLQAANPAIITVESSAFGTTGPWSGRMGYGPLVRAATGLTELWRYPQDPDGYSDSITIYPDHIAARVGAIGAVALLIRRLRTGAGGQVEVAQAEVMLNHFAADVARASAGLGEAAAPDAPWGVYRAAGDDNWCVVTVRHDADWRKLAPHLGLEDDVALATREGRIKSRHRLDKAVAAWMAERDPHEAMAFLQQTGIPAGAMLRISELPEFGLYQERRFYRVEQHPYLDDDVTNERAHASSEDLPEAGEKPAPLSGQNSEEVLKDWLALQGEAFDALVTSDIVQPTEAATFLLIEQARLVKS